MLDWLDTIIENLGWFLDIFIYPFITSLFVILNYRKMRKMLHADEEIVWAKIFLIASVIYFLLTFGFGVYWLIKNIKNMKK